MAGRPAFFIDRDGCLTEEVGYVNHPGRIRLLPRSAEAVRRLNRAGVAAVLATNQAGVARGYFTAEVLEATQEALRAQLAARGAHLDAAYVCTHHPDAGAPPYRARCQCRKPGPGMLLAAAADLGLDLRRSVMAGDKLSDVATAHAAGARGVLVLTGYGRGEWEYRPAEAVQPDHVVRDLLDAVDWALGPGARAREVA